MGKFLLSALIALGFNATAMAQEVELNGALNDGYQESELSLTFSQDELALAGEAVEWFRGPGYRPRPAPGRPAPYPDPGRRPHPRPAPPPHRPVPPPHRPAPPPYYYTEYLQCNSYGYGYNECYYSNFRVQNVRLYSQHSYEACIYGRTYGIDHNRVWVSGGCSATFAIDRYR